MNHTSSKARIKVIRGKILNGNRLANKGQMWAGADLFVSSKPVTCMKGKIVVVTKHAQELSNLVFELQAACADWLNYCSIAK